MTSANTQNLGTLKLHSRFAVHPEFDPAIFNGREIMPYQDIGVRTVGLENVVLERPGINEPPVMGQVISTYDIAKIEGQDNLRYEEVIKVEGIAFQEGDGTRVVSTLDGKVIGVPIGYSGKTVILAPACDILKEPYQHIREAVRDVFNAAVLEGRTVVPENELRSRQDTKHVFIEGKLRSDMHIDSFFEEEFGGKTYRYGYKVNSHSHLGRHFATRADIGKLVLERGDPSKPYNSDNARVVGVVAGIELKQRYMVGDKASTLRRTYIAPAWSLLLP